MSTINYETINKICTLLLAFVFLGCSKEREKVLKDPVEMTFDSLDSISGMRVFTGGGIELNSTVNSQAIQKYLAENYSLKTNTGARKNYQSQFFEPVYSMGMEKPGLPSIIMEKSIMLPRL